MSNIKKVHFAEFVLNVLSVEFNPEDINIDNDDRLIDVEVKGMNIIMMFSDDLKSIRGFQISDDSGVEVYKKRNISVIGLHKEVDKIHSILNNNSVVCFDLSNSISLL